VEKTSTQTVMKNFIVPIDFSEDAFKGLDLALLFASKKQVNIQLVYVQRKSADGIPSDAEEEYKMAEKKFKKIIEQYQPLVKNNSHLTYIIKKGKVYQEIVAQAHAFSDSIIVASTHGASGFEELFIGSNAYKIISATDRPVITIRRPPVPSTIKKIILPIDIVVASRQKVMVTARLAELFGAEIHVVTVSTSKNKKIISRLNAYSKQVCNYLKTKEIPHITASVYGNNLAQMVIDYADKVQADMISIINESGSSISDLIIEGTAHQMISKSTIPVLTIRAKEHFIKGNFSAYA
jgi:nucleotide-binding universal stress UspA family protein